MTFGRRRSANCNEDAVAIALVDEDMSVRTSLGKCSNVAGSHYVTTVVFDQYGFACKHDDHLIFAFMPMPLRRPCAGFKNYVTRTEFR